MAGSLGFASRLGGRGSATGEQAAAQMYSNGIVSGFVVSPATPTANMTVKVGGVAGTPDVMVATNAVGNNVFLKNRNTDAFTLSMTAPASNSVIYSIVGFTDDLSVATSDATSVADNPSKCGVIAVSGTSAASPVAPSDAQIRTAITTAGFTGSQAAYGVIGYVTLTSTTTTITAPNISQTGRTASLNIAKLYAGTTAGVLATDSSGVVTASSMSSATTDANGWSVRTYGPITIASKVKSFTTGSISQGTTTPATQTGNNRPVTFTTSSVVLGFIDIIGGTANAGDVNTARENAFSNIYDLMTSSIIATRIATGSGSVTNGRIFQILTYIG